MSISIYPATSMARYNTTSACHPTSLRQFKINDKKRSRNTFSILNNIEQKIIGLNLKRLAFDKLKRRFETSISHRH